MKIYSDYPLRRATQVTADLLAITIIALGIWAGVTVAAGIAAIADIARQVETAGLEFQVAMGNAGEALGGLPIIGDAARAPFDAAGGAGIGLSSAGQNAAAFITTTAAIVGVVIALVVAAAVLWFWLRRRYAFARRATEAEQLARLADGPDMLALRALVHGSRDELAGIARNPVDAWRSGERDVVTKLADLELRRAGVRLRLKRAR